VHTLACVRKHTHAALSVQLSGESAPGPWSADHADIAWHSGPGGGLRRRPSCTLRRGAAARTDSEVAVHIYKLLVGLQQAVDELGDAEELHLPRGSARISLATELASSQPGRQSPQEPPARTSTTTQLRLTCYHEL